MDVIMWGAGGHASVVAETIAACPDLALFGIVLEAKWLPSAEPSLSSLVLGGREILAELRSRGILRAVVAVGNNSIRLGLAAELTDAGFCFPAIVAPSAIVSPSASIGVGTVVLPRAVINAGAKVGRHCIVNTGAIIEHGSQLGDGVHVSPGAVLAGNVTVGDRTWIGAGATVIEQITIGADSLVGAGAVVVDNVPAGVVAFGVPARVHRQYVKA